MDAEKIRNTTDAELAHQLHEVNDELFQLKFRLRMGQTESLKKIRSLRRDLARIKTISRERQLGLNGPKAAEAKPERPAEARQAERPVGVDGLDAHRAKHFAASLLEQHSKS